MYDSTGSTYYISYEAYYKGFSMLTIISLSLYLIKVQNTLFENLQNSNIAQNVLLNP